MSIASGPSAGQANVAIETSTPIVPVAAPPPAAPLRARGAPVAANAAGQRQLLSVPAGLTAYSIGEPTDEEQLYVERINRARANPTAEGLRLQASTDPEVLRNYRGLSVDLALMASQFAQLNPAPPLSINPKLTAAARVHSQDMLANGFQAHEGSDGSLFDSRAQAQGYAWNTISENVFSSAANVEEGHTAFEVDWGGDASTGGMQDPPGHRLNIHNEGFREIGVGVVNGSNGKLGPQFVTQDFGSRPGITPFITGVIYYDLNGNGAYDLGEGIGGVTVLAKGATYYAVSAGAGGYSIPVAEAGNYPVTFSVTGGADAQAQVTVADVNVKLDRAFSYVPPALSGPDKPFIGQDNVYTFNPVPGATGYEWKRNRVAPGTAIEGAEDPQANVTITSSAGYSPVDHTVAASGQSSFHLAQPLPENQTLTINRVWLVAPATTLSFDSRLSWASSNQVARLQVSLDRGASWQEVWSQGGTGDSGDSEFQTRTIPLGAFAGQEIMVRFIYAYSGGSLFPQTDSGIGFYIDDIGMSNADELLDEVLAETGTGTRFTFAPAQADAYSLSVRPIISGRHFPWGPAKVVAGQVGQGQFASVQLSSLQRLADGRLQIDFAVVNPGSGTYRVEGATDPAGPWAPEAGASIDNVGGPGDFRAVLPGGSGSRRFYRVVYE